MSDVQLFHGDCLEVMKDIPDGSVDMVLCDLPYGTTACKWDVVIPFQPLWDEYFRLCKDSSTIVLFASHPFTTLLISSNIHQFRENLIWVKNKPASGMMADRRHLKVHEDVLVFSNSGKYTYHPQMTKVDDAKFLTHRKSMVHFHCENTMFSQKERVRKPDNGMRYPNTLLHFKIPCTPAKSKVYAAETDISYHPTQKPVALLEYLIKTYTNEGETVLDNCMGSGSTGVACIRTNRNFIGIEKDEKYFQIAKDRIEREQSKPVQQELF